MMDEPEEILERSVGTCVLTLVIFMCGIIAVIAIAVVRWLP